MCHIMRMTRCPTACEIAFRVAAPADLYQGLLTLLQKAYPHAFLHAQGKDFREGAGRILLPHYRRALIESELEALAHQLGLKTRVVRFKGNSDDFVLIEMPNGVELIVCYVQSKDSPVRYARQRHQMSQQSNMPYLDFLEFEPGNLMMPPTGLFAILTHSPDEKDLGRLGAANIIFPSPEAGYSLGLLDLWDEAARVHGERAAAAAQVKRKVEVKVRKVENG